MGNTVTSGEMMRDTQIYARDETTGMDNHQGEEEETG
jgi:hypothetical protein